LSTNIAVVSAPLPQGLSGTSTLGPDLLVGDIPAVAQLGSSGTQVGLGMAATLCNNGDTEFDFFALPNADHPIIAQNLYRMSAGAAAPT
jgi:hypothetical protein